MTNQEIFELMSRFERSGICAMKLKRGDFSLELSKAAPAVSAAAPAPAAVSALQQSADAEARSQDPVIPAPLVGTYYAAPSPDAAPFVAVGDRVKKGQTVCLIEAMKMISEIPAPCDCVITEILKENGTLAAFDEPLFRYAPC